MGAIVLIHTVLNISSTLPTLMWASSSRSLMGCVNAGSDSEDQPVDQGNNGIPEPFLNIRSIERCCPSPSPSYGYTQHVMRKGHILLAFQNNSKYGARVLFVEKAFRAMPQATFTVPTTIE